MRTPCTTNPSAIWQNFWSTFCHALTTDEVILVSAHITARCNQTSRLKFSSSTRKYRQVIASWLLKPEASLPWMLRYLPYKFIPYLLYPWYYICISGDNIFRKHHYIFLPLHKISTSPIFRISLSYWTWGFEKVLFLTQDWRFSLHGQKICFGALHDFFFCQ